jgi:hypothetical protein
MTTISLRCLNRTLLERQFLTERTNRSPHAVIGQLVALQAQEPNWPYVGLWSRLEGFRRDDLGALLHDRSVVRSTMLRRTMHLAGADDCRWLRPTVRPIVQVALKHAYFADEIGGMDLDELVRAGRELLTGRTLTRRELGRLLAERFPGRHPGRLADTVEVMVPLVHAPAAGAWGGWGTRSGIEVALAEEWIGRPMSAAPRLETMVLRYLAAFGPAGVMDIQAWSGLTRLREVVDRLREELRVVRTEGGKELFDLPDAPIADPDRPVPVRFLPAFDNALLGHRDRTRVISDQDRKRFARVASAGVPMFLVDGFVHGTWSLRGSTLLIAPLRPLANADAAAVEEEAEHLLAFIDPDTADRATAWVADGG